MEVNVYVSCHVHVRAVRSGRAAIELWAVRKGWGYTNNEHIHAHLPDQIALKTDTLTDPKLQLLSRAVSQFVANSDVKWVDQRGLDRLGFLQFAIFPACIHSYI